MMANSNTNSSKDYNSNYGGSSNTNAAKKGYTSSKNKISLIIFFLNQLNKFLKSNKVPTLAQTTSLHSLLIVNSRRRLIVLLIVNFI
jgi:hypothetical protein